MDSYPVPTRPYGPIRALVLGLLIGLLASAAAPAFAESATQSFTKDVRTALRKSGSGRTASVVVLVHNPVTDRAYAGTEGFRAFTNTCSPDPHEPCPNEIFVWAETLGGDEAALRLTAYHEACHVIAGDNIFWRGWNARQRAEAHVQVEVCMSNLLGRGYYHALRRKAHGLGGGL